VNSEIFSVIIPTYRRPSVLDKTLQCLECQNCNFHFEVIVVNDGPPDQLPELGFGEKKRRTWKLLQNEKNLGRATTRNRGINSASGAYLLMLDDDIWAVPQLIQAHYDKQKEIGGGVVVGAIPPAKENENTIWNRYIAERYNGIHLRLRSEELDFGLFLTGNVSLPVNVLKQHGGFDEKFKEYSFEDSELGYRLVSNGIRFVHAAETIGYHCFNEDLNKICTKEYEAGRSLSVFVKLHPELYDKMEMRSMILLPWKNIDIIKNIAKLIMYSSILRILLKQLLKFLGSCNNESMVFRLLPWLELMHRAKGVEDSRVSGKHGKTVN